MSRIADCRSAVDTAFAEVEMDSPDCWPSLASNALDWPTLVDIKTDYFLSLSAPAVRRRAEALTQIGDGIASPTLLAQPALCSGIGYHD
jgi:hypothetical protein